MIPKNFNMILLEIKNRYTKAERRHFKNYARVTEAAGGRIRAIRQKPAFAKVTVLNRLISREVVPITQGKQQNVRMFLYWFSEREDLQQFVVPGDIEATIKAATHQNGSIRPTHYLMIPKHILPTPPPQRQRQRV